MTGTKRFVFICLSVTLGTVVAVAVALLVLAWHSGPRRARPSDYATLKAQLDANPKALYVFDPETSYRLKPSYKGLRWGTADSPHETNSRGLLGAAEIDPSPSRQKVLFLGDSVTYGDGVPIDVVFVSQMQEMAGRGGNW